MQAVRVGASWNDEGLDFWRATCYQYLPQPPRSAADFILPRGLSRASPINVYILPPMCVDAALRNVTFARSVNLAVVTVRQGPHVQSFPAEREDGEAFIDIEEHPKDVFCVVHMKDGGVYEASHIFSLDGRAVISQTTLVFAPSAWKHGATVLANRGRCEGDKIRLYCRLHSGDLVHLDVEGRFVEIADSWASLRESGEPWKDFPIAKISKRQNKWAMNCLGTADSDQEAFIVSARAGRDTVAVAEDHMPGKSTVAEFCCLWESRKQSSEVLPEEVEGIWAQYTSLVVHHDHEQQPAAREKAVWPTELLSLGLESEVYLSGRVDSFKDCTCRNQFISRYIWETTKEIRTPRQVASRLLKLKRACYVKDSTKQAIARPKLERKLRRQMSGREVTNRTRSFEILLAVPYRGFANVDLGDGESCVSRLRSEESFGGKEMLPRRIGGVFEACMATAM
ncbi:hypothetical protein DFH06DRAFT_1151826 [Mycena polygramma]|nr:hypothetical protein DFH06DRAFT_1151826 [Mycena polygramma]